MVAVEEVKLDVGRQRQLWAFVTPEAKDRLACHLTQLLSNQQQCGANHTKVEAEHKEGEGDRTCSAKDVLCDISSHLIKELDKQRNEQRKNQRQVRKGGHVRVVEPPERARRAQKREMAGAEH